MNLEDVVDPEYGLQQDDWSLSKPMFGKEGQLEVIGWSGKNPTHKFYILKCSKCSQDSDLFGCGYFKSVKGSLVKGQLPCGCSKKTLWSKDQYVVLCSRKAKDIGYTFLGFVGEWQGSRSKIKILCEKHGEWSSGIIDNFTHVGNGCPLCGDEVSAEAKIKPDHLMIESFFASGAFHPETKFWRSDRKDSRMSRAYWFVYCPECGETGQGSRSNLQKGKRPCGCSGRQPREAYINLLVDNHNTAVAIKFGIAHDSKQRIKTQKAKSTYTLKQHSVYTFPDVASCKRAESECKQEFETGVVLKRDMPDGYTETTWVYNLEKIEEIYKRNGGVEIIS